MENETQDRKKETMLAVVLNSFNGNFTAEAVREIKDKFLICRAIGSLGGPEVEKALPSQELIDALDRAYRIAQLSVYELS